MRDSVQLRCSIFEASDCVHAIKVSACHYATPTAADLLPTIATAADGRLA